MIGKITLQSGDVVVLPDDSPIQSTNPSLQAYVQDELNYYKYSPADGPFGVSFLHQMAEKLGGEVEIEEKPPSPPDTVY